MKRISSALSRSWMFLLTLPLTVLLWWALVFLPPASHYIQAQSVFVEDSDTDTPVIMHVIRDIKRDFFGTYYVQVKVLNSDGSITTVCEGTGGGDYSTAGVLPDPLYLGWWAGNSECNIIGTPGLYQVSTFWVVKTPLGRRSTMPILSNVFVISESQSCSGYKVSSRGIIHGPDSRYREMVVGPCHTTYQAAEEYRDGRGG